MPRIRIMLPLLLLTALTILPAWELSAGKPLKTDEKDIRTTVRAWLEGFLGEEETRQVIAQYPGVKGEQTWDLVVHAKARDNGFPSAARVQTVFLISSGTGDHGFDARIRDLLKEKKFGFKMPSGMQVKINHTFNIQ